MGDTQAQLAALEQGRAWADLGRTHRCLTVSGADALTWLGDLVTGPVARLEDGAATRSLLLTPTGRIRADLWIGRSSPSRFLVLQTLDQPDAIDRLLSRYVLSSAVSLDSAPATMIEVGAVVSPPPGAAAFSPGVTGVASQVLVDEGTRTPERLASDAGAQVQAEAEALELRRVRLGLARFPVDLPEGALPAEDPAAEAAIDAEKGCFLGQESVAKIRNLGHPTHLVRCFDAPPGSAPGDPVTVTGDSEPIGAITSAAADGDRTVVMARFRWLGDDRRLGSLRTSRGMLEPRTPVR